MNVEVFKHLIYVNLIRYTPFSTDKSKIEVTAQKNGTFRESPEFGSRVGTYFPDPLLPGKFVSVEGPAKFV